MESVISKKGQVVVPKELREKYRIKSGTRLLWIGTGSVIKVVPIPDDPIRALRGCAEEEELTRALLESRKRDRERPQSPIDIASEALGNVSSPSACAARTSP